MPKARHPVLLTAAAFILLLVCSNYGTAVLLFVGFPGFMILVGIAGGARMPSKIPARDTIVYVFISLGVVVAAILLAVYAVHTNRDIFDLNSRWTTITFAAICAFGFIIKDFRIHRHRTGFWLLFAGLLAAHFAILPFVFPAGKQVAFLLAAPLLCIGEMFALYILFGLSGFPPKRSQPHNGS